MGVETARRGMSGVSPTGSGSLGDVTRLAAVPSSARDGANNGDWPREVSDGTKGFKDGARLMTGELLAGRKIDLDHRLMRFELSEPLPSTASLSFPSEECRVGSGRGGGPSLIISARDRPLIGVSSSLSVLTFCAVGGRGVNRCVRAPMGEEGADFGNVGTSGDGPSLMASINDKPNPELAASRGLEAVAGRGCNLLTRGLDDDEEDRDRARLAAPAEDCVCCVSSGVGG